MTVQESNRIALCIAIGFGLLAFLWGVMIPVGESPDEQPHIAYAEFLSSNFRLPVVSDTAQFVQGEAVQPPLYYAMLAGLVRVAGFRNSLMRWVSNPDFDRTSVIGRANAYLNSETRKQSGPSAIFLYHLLRIPTIFFGVFTIWWTWLGLRELKLGSPISLILLAVWASTPQMTFMSGIVGNDVPAAALAALFFWLFARGMCLEDQKTLVLSSFALAAALLTKNTMVPLWLGAVIVCLFNFRRTKLRIGMSAVVVIPVLLAGWSIVRGQLLLDQVMAVKVETDRIIGISDGIAAYASSWLVSTAKHFYHFSLGGIGVIGLNSILLPGYVYGLYIGIALIVLGIIWQVRPNSYMEWLREPYSPLLIGVFLLSAAAIYLFRETGDAMPGRHGLAYMPGLIAFSVAGVDRYRRAINSLTLPHAHTSFWSIVCGGGLVLSVIILATDSIWLSWVAGIARNAGFGMPIAHYVSLARTFLLLTAAACAICLLWNLKGRSYFLNWNPTRKQIVLTVSALYGVNLIILVFYIMRFYS